MEEHLVEPIEQKDEVKNLFPPQEVWDSIEPLLVGSSLLHGLEKYSIIKFINTTFTCHSRKCNKAKVCNENS